MIGGCELRVFRSKCPVWPLPEKPVWGSEVQSRSGLRVPLSNKFGTIKTVNARFWPGLEPFLSHFSSHFLGESP